MKLSEAITFFLATKRLILQIARWGTGPAIVPRRLPVHEGFFAYEEVIKDDVLARLSTVNSVIITPHLAFLTKEALTNIANTTLKRIVESKEGRRDGDLPNSAVPMPG